jgi:hypothetical protein
MKSTTKPAARFAEELNQSTENSEKKEGIQHVTAKLRLSLKKIWKAN